MAVPRGWFHGIVFVFALAASLASAQTNDPARILHVPKEFRAELVATAPAILNPSAIAFDENGRMFVLEQSGQVRVLSDADTNGTFTANKVFADGISSPNAVFCANRGLFVAAGNQLLFLQDTNGDGIADINRTTVANTGVGNGRIIRDLAWRSDNRLFAVGAGFSFNLRSLQAVPELTVGERSLCFDEQGRPVYCADGQPFQTAMLDPRYPASNPFLQPHNPIQNILGLDEAVRVTGSSLVYRGLTPTNYFRNLLIADPSAHSIHSLALRDAGLELGAVKPAADFITSDDPEFAPRQIVAGPGGIYIVDAQAGRSQQGRIWRITPKSVPLPIIPTFGKATTYELVASLAATDSWRRDTAARLLCERPDRTALPLLVSMLRYAKIPEARLNALQTLGNLGGLTEDNVVTALQDRDARVRTRAIALSERFIKNKTISLQLAHWLALAAQDPSEGVRYQLAFTLGEFNSTEKSSLLAGIFNQDPNDLWLETAVLSSLNEGAGDFFVQLASRPDFRLSLNGTEFLRKILNLVGVQNQPAEVSRALAYIENNSFESGTAYIWLRDLADGLRRGGSSLGEADPGDRLLPLYQRAFTAACDESESVGLRVASIRLFEVANYNDWDTTDYFLALVVPVEPPEIQIASIHVLARYNVERVAAPLIQRRPALAPAMRGEILAALLTRTNNASALLSALESGGDLRPADFSSVQINYLRTYGDANIERRAANIFGAQNTNGVERVKEFAPALKLMASAERGRNLFNARCIVCHSNGKFGPVLSYGESPNRGKILSDIVDAGAEISPGYSTYTVDLHTGEKLPGLMTDPGAAVSLLRQPDGKEVVMPRAGRSYVVRQNWSLMPDEAVEGLNPQDLADLIEYVAGLRVP